MEQSSIEFLPEKKSNYKLEKINFLNHQYSY
jgi:hypothetical protein